MKTNNSLTQLFYGKGVKRSISSNNDNRTIRAIMVCENATLAI